MAADPFSYFSFRWAPGPEGLAERHVLELPNTRIEFLIESIPEGTKVTVKESGFASLPEEYADAMHNQNTGGWQYMADRLEKLFEEN